MQLKTSYFNRILFRKNLTRFWPLWGLASAGGAMVPLALLMQILRYGVEDTFRQGAVELSAAYYEVVSYGVPIISLIYAVLVAIAVWSFLYNHRSVSMMHALPVQREGIFVTNFLSGMAMLLIPYVITGGLCVLISLCCGLFALQPLLVTVACVLGETFFYFASATFCAFVVSNVFAMPVVYFLLHFLAVLADAVVGDFSAGFLFGLTGGYSGAVEYLSPTVYLMNHVGADRSYEELAHRSEYGEIYYESLLVDVALENAWLIAVYACVGVLLLGFGWLLYQRHRSESAGDVVAVEGLRPVFRYGVAILGSLVGGIVLYAVFWESFQTGKYYDVLPLLLFMVIAGLVGYFAACMLLEKSFRVFRGRWKGSVLVLVFCVAVCGVLRFDVFRVSQRIPAIDEVQWVEFSAADNTYMFYPGEEDHLLEEVRAFHTAVVEDMDYARDMQDIWYNYSSDYEEDYSREGVRFVYRLNGGREIQRYYQLALTRDRIYETGTYDYLLDQLINSQEMRRKRLHVGDERYSVESGDIYLEKRQIGFDFNSREAAEVLSALERDAAAGTWGTFAWFDSTRAGDYAMSMDLRFDYRRKGEDYDYRDWVNIRINPGMTHTVACLKTLGYLTEEDLVTYAQLYPQDYTEEMQVYYEKYGVMPAEAVSVIGGADRPTTVAVG